jgi:template-activating factor I
MNWQTFSENPYFEDKELTKTYAFADDGTTTINATSIKWKEGMVLCSFKSCF